MLATGDGRITRVVSATARNSWAVSLSRSSTVASNASIPETVPASTVFERAHRATLDGDIRLVCVLQFRYLAVQRGRRLDDVTRLVGKAEPLTVILTRCAALDERRESVGTALTTVPHG